MEIEINDENFEKEVIEKSKEKPVVVDFWAPWCQPCLILGPTLEKIAGDNDKFILAKYNVQKNKENASKYGVMSIPAVKMFKNEKIADEFVGARPEAFIQDWLNKNL